MVTTYADVFEFRAAASAYEQKEKDNKNSKLLYACRKVFKKSASVVEKHNETIEDLTAEHAATDSNGVFLEGEKGGYRFDKAGKKALNEAVRKLRKTEVNIAGLAHFASEIPSDIDPGFIDAFVGFVIDPEWVNEDGELIKYVRDEPKEKNKKE